MTDLTKLKKKELIKQLEIALEDKRFWKKATAETNLKLAKAQEENVFLKHRNLWDRLRNTQYKN